MAFSLNKVTLLGNLGADAEVRTTSKGTKVANFRVATEHSFKVNEEWQKETTWHSVSLFRLNDFLEGVLKKGAKVAVTGRLRNRKYEQDGVEKYVTEIIADEVIPTDSYKSGQSQSSSPSTSAPSAPAVDDDDLPF